MKMTGIIQRIRSIIIATIYLSFSTNGFVQTSHSSAAETANIHSGESAIAVGMDEAAVLERLGRPAGSMTSGIRKILLYNDINVVIEHGKVADVHHQISSTRERRRPAAGPTRHDAALTDIESIISALRNTSGVHLANAVRACRRKGSESTIPYLIPLLGDETQLRISLTSHRGLTGITTIGLEVSNSLIYIGSPSWDPCLEVLNTGTPIARVNAAHTLKRILRHRVEEDIAAFHEALLIAFDDPVMTEDKASHARVDMAHYIVDIPSAAALESLHQALNGTHPHLASGIANLLGRRRDPQSIPLLAQLLLKSDDEGCRENAGSALRNYSNTAAAMAVMEGATHPDARVRQLVVNILVSANDPVTVQALTILSRDSDLKVRQSVLYRLLRIEDAWVIPVIRHMHENDSNPDIRTRSKAFLDTWQTH